MSLSPQEWHARALALEQTGQRIAALGLLVDALAEHPRNARLHNSAGSMAMRGGDATAAAASFAAALAHEPGNLEFVINRAIALGGCGRHDEALAVLRAQEQSGKAIARYWSARGASARAANDPAEAAACYDRCLALDAGHAKALHGRARTALDRGEDDALERFNAALAVNAADADLWLGKAQALDAAGEPVEARRIAEQLVAQAPQWLDALKFLAQLRLAAGEANFADHYADAAARAPQDPSIPAAHAAVLAGLDYTKLATDVAAAASERFPQSPRFALLEAIYAGEAGDNARAEAIWLRLADDTPERRIHEARHRIRRGELDRAEQLLTSVLEQSTMVHSAYALLGLIWRLTGDGRAEWLHGQEGLVRLLPLREAGVLPRAIARLHELHDHSPLPLGQSLRGGTQTRHILFHRHEAVFGELQRAILATLDDYRDGLPPADSTHPLLRHRDDPWRLAGSWSVRLHGGGDYHTSHIHPEGMLSSALYLIVPEDAHGDGQRGWLEIGRPPPDLRLDLGPLQTIRPAEAHLALFPSTLYHGTRPFGDAQRMTVAFDVVQS